MLKLKLREKYMRGILIAGNESALLNFFEAEAAKRAEHYALAIIKNRFSDGNQLNGNTEANNESLIQLEWNPGSPISASNLILAAKNRLENISEAILICDPPSVYCAAADIKIVDVEVLANDHIKGWFYLVRELVSTFREKGEGALALVFPESAAGNKDDAADLLGSAAAASFKALTKGLLAASVSEPYITMGFSGACTGEETSFASFVFKHLDEKTRRSNGKFHKYGKMGFFR